MKIDILSLFPNMFEGFLNSSIIARAIKQKIIEINIIDFRDYSILNNKQVDDTPYGGGSGMVLMCDPIFRCINDIKKENSKVILLTPDGSLFNQGIATELSKFKHLILLCGHYEGFDARIKSICDYEISIGDYVLTGGELPSMIITDTISRLVDGVINSESLDSESFTNNLLDYDVYTKPSDYNGLKVPEVLISGDHQKICEWRNNNQLEKTKTKRPDLLK